MNGRWRYLRLLAEVLRQSWRHHPGATAALLTVKAASAGTTPMLALALRAAIDEIIRGDRAAAVAGAAGAALVFGLTVYLRDLSRVLDAMLVDRIGVLHLRRDVESRLARLPSLGHLERTDLLDRVTLLRGFGWRLSASLWSAVIALFVGLRLILLLILLGTAVTPWLLPLVAFAAAPIYFERRGQRTVFQAELDTAEAYRLQRELFNLATGPAGGKEIRVCGVGGRLAAHQQAAWSAAQATRYQARVRAAAGDLAGWALFTAGLGAGLAVVVYRAARGESTVGDLVLAVTVAATLRDALQDALSGVSEAMAGRTLADPYLWLRRYAETTARRGDLPAPAQVRDGITVEDVSFSYPGSDRPALDGVSCLLPAGAVVAVVGEYGSGKSTLVKLLTKFYEPDAGRIAVDGIDLTDVDTERWRALSSAAFQDFGRFQIRFRDAVGVGDLPRLHDDDRVAEAVRAADAGGFVQRLPDGLDTQLGRAYGGVELSEGQWQKTALARASMRTEPVLFVLDEPTASLDAPSEHAIFERYMARARDLARRTGAITVVVSHRFSTVAGADHILVLDDGRLVEQGTHDQLLAAGGRYAGLYRIQADAYADA
ncbi:MAG: ABC transporter ATP-binding protein [Hamadaea sp.]|uniref:ABC transporter ATP-binding protein n=1 Tax=Hamadaea sp. TaxID=2024425 RepID=UPI0017F3F0B6|nr:ABC transporter ATP-binding protein [Hamadaea sp.]NUR69413.1 ABC transporter ATP-binding protein [Hamadaea sp.]NUT23828.1 ABC transporter ATP-binding protein [Hamadaea sp.]